MAKELRRKIVPTMALALVYICACVPEVRADESTDPISTYGLAHIVSTRLANPDVMTVDVAPVAIHQKIFYVVDFYGDGLIRYPLRDLPDFDGERMKISLRRMSDIVSGVALGQIPQASRIKAEEGAIVLEAEQGEITIEQGTDQIEMKKLRFYQIPWVTPPRYTVKKNKGKALAQITRLQAVAEQ